MCMQSKNDEKVVAKHAEAGCDLLWMCFCYNSSYYTNNTAVDDTAIIVFATYNKKCDHWMLFV